MNKRNLMLSTAAVALMAAPLFAATTATATVDKDDICLASANIHCVYSSTKDPLATSTATGVNKAAGPSNIYIFNDSDNGNGSVSVGKSNAAVITLDSSNYVYSNGAISDTDHSGAVGIRIDTSKNPNVTGIHFNNGTAQDYEFENYGEQLITGAAVYLDASSTLYVSGSGSSKAAIWLDANGATGSLTGDIITYYGSVISVKGDNSYGLRLDNGVTMNGNIELSGTMSMYQTTAKSMEYSGLFGLYMNGRVNGNVGIYDSGTMLVAGSGARGMFISGDGVGGNVVISGTLETEGIDSSSLTSSSSYYYSTKKYTYPDAGPALTINASVAKGVEITGLNYDDDSSSTAGSVVTYGTDSTILISPTVTVGSATHTMSGPLVLGLYQSYDRDTHAYTYETYDPGFSFYNRGSVSLSPVNVNHSVGSTIHVVGTAALPTYINGGFFSSGTVSAQSTTDASDKNVTATAIFFDGNVKVGGYYDGTAYAPSSITYGTCTLGLCDYTFDSGIPSAISGTARRDDGKDNAVFVNSGDTGGGTISAAVSGKGGGIATALLISKDSTVPSLRNSGTISASVTTSNTDISNPVEAYAIRDLSGSLTLIYNAGTIAASATTLDSDDQIADAINLTGNALTSASADGVTIINRATSTKAATITGDIRFGVGDNQRIYIAGASSSYLGRVVGDIYYGACKSGAGDCGDVLSIGAFGAVQGNVSGAYSTDANGNVTYLNRIAVDVANNGLLSLLNDKNVALAASTVDVKDGGYISIGLKQDSGLNNAGYIQANGTINIESGANMGVGYNSYAGGADGSAASYVLMKTSGSLNVADLATYAHNISTPMSSTCSFGTSVSNCGSMPFLLKSTTLSQKSVVENGTTYNELVLTVTPKTAEDLKLTGYGKQMFSSINQAVATDDDLGAAMINGVHADVGDLYGTGSSVEAQRAYDSYAPNVSGGTRAIALSITDQATGVVAARQRSLRLYAKEEGEMTLWSQEFVQSIKNPGQGTVQVDESREKTGFRDHGFGVVVGMDAGNPTDGWYGGALTFYNGDVNEINRTSHENQLWFVGTGYGTWRGKGLFFDGKVDIGYAHIKGLRSITLKVGTGSSETSYTREAQSAHSAASMSGGFTSGATFTYGAFTFLPQVSVDALYLRENGYTEFNPSDTTPDADGFSLTVKSHDAKSLRTFFGSSVRYDLDLLGVFLQPELRAGYRYDFLSDPVRLRAAFKDINPTLSGNQNGGFFTLTGPDPSQGNFVLGSSLGAASGAWSLNLSYDYIRGSRGNLEQAATLNLIGRI